MVIFILMSILSFIECFLEVYIVGIHDIVGVAGGSSGEIFVFYAYRAGSLYENLIPCGSGDLDQIDNSRAFFEGVECHLGIGIVTDWGGESSFFNSRACRSYIHLAFDDFIGLDIWGSGLKYD